MDFATRGGGLPSLPPSQFLASARDLRALAGHMPGVEARYAQLNGLGVPLRVLLGRDDAMLDWRANGQAPVDQVAGARLEQVEGWHMLPLTQPARTARFIEDVAGARLALAS